MNFRRFLALAGVMCPLMYLSGCTITSDRSGPSQYETQSFDRGSIDELHAEFSIGAGDLKVGTGTHKLAQTYFSYNVTAWKPEVRFEPQGTHANLTFREPDHHGANLGRSKNEWDIRLNQEAPLFLNVNCGAGHAQLDVGSLALRDVRVNMGVGQLEMDLRGDPKHDYDVRIDGGVGEATVRLPSTAGVMAEASGGIGSIDVQNLNKVDGHWVNEEWDRAKVHIHLTVNGGVGSIKLIGE